MNACGSCGKDVDDTIAGDGRARPVSGLLSGRCTDAMAVRWPAREGRRTIFTRLLEEIVERLAGAGRVARTSFRVRRWSAVRRTCRCCACPSARSARESAADTRTPTPVSKFRHCAQAWRSAPQRAHRPSALHAAATVSSLPHPRQRTTSRNPGMLKVFGAVGGCPRGAYSFFSAGLCSCRGARGSSRYPRCLYLRSDIFGCGDYTVLAPRGTPAERCRTLVEP